MEINEKGFREQVVDDDVVCHIYKVRLGSEIYNITACGNKHSAEKYMQQELHADEITWLKSFLMNADYAYKMSKSNRVIATDAFLISMKFLTNFATKKNNNLKLNARQKGGEDNIVSK